MTLDERTSPQVGPSGPPVRPRHDGRGLPLRAPLAAAALVTAAAHIPVTGEHLDEAFYIGALFIALEIASVGLAIALVRPSRVVYLAISVVGVLAIAAFVISRSVGLPLIADDIGNWTEPLAEVSVAAELVMAIGGVVAAFGAVRRSRTAGVVGVVAGAVLLVAGCVLTVVAAGHETDGDAGMTMTSTMHTDGSGGA